MIKKWVNHTSARSAIKISCAALMVALAGCGSLADFRDENKGIQLDTLKTAPGFKVAVYATDLPKARQMALGSRGTLFVGSNAGNVYALTITSNAVAQQRVILSDITSPSGVAFYQGALYVSARTKILRYDDIENRLNNPPAPTIVIDGLPDKERHGAHYMAFGPDGKFMFQLAHRAIFAKRRMTNSAPSSGRTLTAVVTKLLPAAFATASALTGIRNRASYGLPSKAKII